MIKQRLIQIPVVLSIFITITIIIIINIITIEKSRHITCTFNITFWGLQQAPDYKKVIYDCLAFLKS